MFFFFSWNNYDLSGQKQSHCSIYQPNIVLWCPHQGLQLLQPSVMMEKHLHQHSKLIPLHSFLSFFFFLFSFLRSLILLPILMLFCVCSGDHTVKIIDCHTGRCLKVLSGHRRTPWVVRSLSVYASMHTFNFIVYACLDQLFGLFGQFLLDCCLVTKIKRVKENMVVPIPVFQIKLHLSKWWWSQSIALVSPMWNPIIHSVLLPFKKYVCTFMSFFPF